MEIPKKIVIPNFNNLYSISIKYYNIYKVYKYKNVLDVMVKYKSWYRSITIFEIDLPLLSIKYTTGYFKILIWSPKYWIQKSILSINIIRYGNLKVIMKNVNKYGYF